MSKLRESYNNLKLSAKLILGFLFIAFLCAVVGGVGLYSISRISAADNLLYEGNTLGIKSADDAAIYYQRLKYNLAEIIMLKDDSLADEYAGNINAFIETIDTDLAAYEEDIITEEDRQLFDAVNTSWGTFKSYVQQAVGYIQSGQYTRAEKLLLEDAKESGDAMRDGLTKLMEYNSRNAGIRAESNARLANESKILMVAFMAAGIILAVVTGIWLSRRITVPIRRIAAAAERLALGDTEIHRTIYTKDEIGQMADSFSKVIDSTKEQAETIERIADGDLTVDVRIRSDKDLLGQKLAQMVRNLNRLVRDIMTAADQASAGARQIADSSVQLSQGATEQASSIEELTASIEEVASQTKSNAESASHANKAAEEVKNYAAVVSRHIQEMLDAMTKISESSGNVGKIIKVIDDIAFQTNILALNAAVEAARAGAAGKGFAVVAEEVRNLAARSAEAVKNTTAYIEDSIKKIEDGSRIASETAEAVGRIIKDVDAVSNLMKEINAASNEQAAAIAQINEGISLVSQVVQENSATSEESAAASEELSSQAESLKQMVAAFKTKSTDESAALLKAG